MVLSKTYHLYKLFNLYKNLNDIQNSDTLIINCKSTQTKLKTIRNEILEGGCLEIKFAQWFISKLKSNTDENSISIINYFNDIFEQCPRHLLKDTFLTFKNDFNLNMQDIIKLDSLKCIASGSVGQVYKALLITPLYIIDSSHKKIIQILKDNNIEIEYIINEIWVNKKDIPFFLLDIIKKVEWVAIKVKHPNVNEDVNYKIECFNLLKYIQTYQKIKNIFGLHVDFNDFIENIIQQIDFTNEYKNCNKFRKNYAGNYLNEFPRVLWSSYNITISEYITSKNLEDISEFLQLKSTLNFACSISKMILIDNFCHGDVHDKNWGIVIYNDDEIQNEPKLIYYDYGICFQSVNKDFNCKLWEDFETTNVDKILENVNEMIIGDFNNEDIKIELNEMIDHFKNNSLDIVNLMFGLNKILEKHNCKLSSILLNLVLILALIDSTLKKQNLIGIKTEISENHYINLRSKSLDMISYCNSKNIYSKLVIYMNEKQKRLSKNEKSNDIFAFGISNDLDLDLPE